jgi:hypothetical protein
MSSLGSQSAAPITDPAHDQAATDAGMAFPDVLRDELEAILGIALPKRVPPVRNDANSNSSAEASERAYEQTVLKAVDDSAADLSALCLSGGGIRSATFALGVMQGLARFGLLGHFHYLSSVSGGGYIASWLSAWRHITDDAIVLKAINSSMETGKEPAEITGIRQDSNYLTPRLGLLSADTWTVITLYVRNLLLNWILFVPFFMGCLMVPRLCLAILTSVNSSPTSAAMFYALRLIGGIFVLTGLCFGIYGRFRKQGLWLTNGLFKWTVLTPLLISGALFTVAAVLIGKSHGTVLAEHFAREHLGYGAGFGAVIYFAAWLIGRLTSLSDAEQSEKAIEKLDVVFWTGSGAVVGLLVSVEMSAIADSISRASDGALMLTEVLGISGCVMAYLLGELLYVGLASFSPKGDMDREWLGRSSGWLSAVTVAWAAISAIALYAPHLLHCGWPKLTLTTGGISGLVTLILGSSSRTGATKAADTLKSIPLMRIASAAAIIFAVLIASLLALADQQVERALIAAMPCSVSVIVIDGVFVLVSIMVAVALSFFINVNRFSMHALYRNRLVRAFLGSARAGARKADPFTSFDQKDNLPLAMVEPVAAKDKLFHVINAALNLVSAKNPAWQERKAESFTMSRLHCGNPYVRYRATETYGGPVAPKADPKNGGISLGTAMAISGAAVSPNQGYNSSPLIGFLLMLFNVRLGWWLGNPRKSIYHREGPTFSLSPALRELAGDTTDDSKWIYLSDGGHFENLGLYEMVRRRCRAIVVSDAGCDPDCSFEDLGNAVRKIYIDFGVSIIFDKLEIKPRQNPPVPGLRFAVGSIKYPGSSRLGWLLYIKPTYQGTERADIRSYASASLAFPHESTTDQWFSESQLESYRALGASIAEYICSGGRGAPAGHIPTPMTLDLLKEVVKQLLATEILRADSPDASEPTSQKSQ